MNLLSSWDLLHRSVLSAWDDCWGKQSNCVFAFISLHLRPPCYACSDTHTANCFAVYQRFQEAGEVPADWKVANIILIYKKGRKEEPGKYTPVGLTSVPGKVMVIILCAIGKHLKNKAIVRHRLPGFMEEKSCCSSLISLL